MIGNWNYENYVKAIVPLILAVVALLQGWVETGGLEKAELNTVIYLAAAALIVFLAPNIKIAKGSEVVEGDPNRSQQLLLQRSAQSRDERQAGQPNITQPNAVPQAAPQADQPTTRTRRRTPPKE